MSEQQNYSNHTRWQPLVHFVLMPIFFFNFFWQIVRLYQEPSWDRGESVLIAFALIGLNVAARMQALRAQDRVIRLEESLRFARVLDSAKAAVAEALPTSMKIALRFAPDAELAELVDKISGGQLKTPKEVKLAIKSWRGDYLRV